MFIFLWQIQWLQFFRDDFVVRCLAINSIAQVIFIHHLVIIIIIINLYFAFIWLMVYKVFIINHIHHLINESKMLLSFWLYQWSEDVTEKDFMDSSNFCKLFHISRNQNHIVPKKRNQNRKTLANLIKKLKSIVKYESNR